MQRHRTGEQPAPRSLTNCRWGRCGSPAERVAEKHDDVSPRSANWQTSGNRGADLLGLGILSLLRAGAASGLLLVVDAIDEKEAPREAHNRECSSTPSRDQLR